MEKIVIYLPMVQKLLNLKQNIPKFVTPLCLGNIPEDFSAYNMKKTGWSGYIYYFSVDCDAILVDDILDIPRYLMKKNGAV